MLPLVLVFLLLLSPSPAQNKITGGFISTFEDFIYVDRFCFQSETGTLEYTFKYPTYYPAQMLLLYYDTEEQWPRAYSKLTECSDRVQILTNHSENNQIIHLSPFNDYSEGQGKCRIVEDQINTTWVVCKGTRVFRSARSRWWFLALANCDPDNDVGEMNETMGLYAEYDLLMTNGQHHEFFRFHFSDDEWMILPTNIIFVSISGVLLLVSSVFGINLKSRRLYHNTFRLFTYSLMFDIMGLIFLISDGSLYAMNGKGTPPTKVAGILCRALAEAYFIYICMVLARGLNVTKMKLSQVDKGFITVMFFVFMISFGAMQAWTMLYYNPATMLSYTDSVPGYLLSVWRMVAWLYFLFGVYVTREASPQKRNFFDTFAVLLTPWFIAPPIAQIIVNAALNNWVRAEVENIITNTIIVYGYCVFLWISRPTDNNTNFPFHIRTTQIDIGFDPNTAYANNEAENISDEGHDNVVMNKITKRTENDTPDHPQYT